MKRLVSLCLIVLWALNPATSFALESDFCSITELRQHTTEHWQQTYATPWRDVNIDAKVILPQVTQFPVLLVSNDAHAPAVSAEQAGFAEACVRPYAFLWVNDEPDYPRKQNGKRLNRYLEPLGTAVTDGFATSNTYVPLSNITFGEIVGLVESAVTNAGYDADAFTFRTPEQLRSLHLFYYGIKQDALPGAVQLSFRPCMAGVPVLSHVYTAVTNHFDGESRVGEFVEVPHCLTVYSGYCDELVRLFLWTAKIDEKVVSDVPLCPIDKVVAAIESEIEAGHIRKIYEMELGYVLYNVPGAYRERQTPKVEVVNGQDEEEYGSVKNEQERAKARYYARPMWQINCLWVNQPSASPQGTDAYIVDERDTLHYRELLVDAQTGTLVQESTAFDRCEYKRVLSWDDVGR